MKTKAVWWSIFALIITLGISIKSAEAQTAPPLIVLASQNQSNSLTLRDHCKYQQQAHVELYKKGKKGEQGELDKTRDTTVVVEPSTTPDETGQYLVNNRVIADTDDKGKPKGNVDPKARTGLASGAFLDLLFFPLLPEKLPYLEFQELKSDRANEKLFRFMPKAGVTNIVLATGQVYLNPDSGAVLTVKIDNLTNLKSFDKLLEKLDISAVVDFSEFDTKYRMPTLARGMGNSDVTRFKGIFKFTFEETKYSQVLALKLP